MKTGLLCRCQLVHVSMRLSATLSLDTNDTSAHQAHKSPFHLSAISDMRLMTLHDLNDKEAQQWCGYDAPTFALVLDPFAPVFHTNPPHLIAHCLPRFAQSSSGKLEPLKETASPGLIKHVCLCVCVCVSVCLCLSVCVWGVSLSRLVSSRLVSCLSLLQSYVELCFNAQEMDSLKADVDAARTAQRTADQHVRVCVRVCVCVLKGAHNCQSLAVCFAWYQQPCPYAQCTYTPTHAHVLTHLYASPCPCRQWQWRGKTRR